MPGGGIARWGKVEDKVSGAERGGGGGGAGWGRGSGAGVQYTRGRGKTADLAEGRIQKKNIHT